MNVTILIGEIRRLPILWDATHPSYNNKLMHEPFWDVIAKTMGSTRDAVKTKWKNLRDAYLKALKKASRDGTEIRWIHRRHMRFLKPQILNYRPRRRRDAGAVLAVDDLTTVKMEVVENSLDYKRAGDDSVGDCSYTSENALAKDGQDQQENDSLSDNEPLAVTQAKRKNADFQNTFPKGEPIAKEVEPPKETKLSLSEECDAAVRISAGFPCGIAATEFNAKSVKRKRSDEDVASEEVDLRNDPDYQFLMSLLPHIKDVPFNKKLQLRMKIESVVHEFAYCD